MHLNGTKPDRLYNCLALLHLLLRLLALERLKDDSGVMLVYFLKPTDFLTAAVARSPKPIHTRKKMFCFIFKKRLRLLLAPVPQDVVNVHLLDYFL